MKQFFSILCVCVLCSTMSVWAQEGSDIYLFDEFEEATVYFKNGTYSKEKINYDIARGEFAFLTKDHGEIRNISDIDPILVIKVGQRTFYPDKTGGMEMVSTSPLVYVQYKGVARAEKPKGAYGQTSETSSIRSYGSLTSDGKRYEIGSTKVELINQYNIYWIEKNDKKRQFKNANQFIKIYPKHKATVDAYIKEHTIDFRDVDAVIKLCVYAEGL